MLPVLSSPAEMRSTNTTSVCASRRVSHSAKQLTIGGGFGNCYSSTATLGQSKDDDRPFRSVRTDLWGKTVRERLAGYLTCATHRGRKHKHVRRHVHRTDANLYGTHGKRLFSLSTTLQQCVRVKDVRAFLSYECECNCPLRCFALKDASDIRAAG